MTEEIKNINFNSMDLSYEKKNKYVYTVGEEIFNSVTHGIGALMACAAIALLVVFSPKTGLAVTSVSIYGASLFLMYLMSCLYHALTNIKAKKVFQIFDHSAIYLLIAGTYTPYCLLGLKGAFGWTIFGIIWAIAVTGIVLYSVFGNKMRKISSVTYVIMGWLVLLVFIPLLEVLPKRSFAFLVLGGVMFTMGFPFYKAKQLKWTHSVFHLFVIAASIFHFFSVFIMITSYKA